MKRVLYGVAVGLGLIPALSGVPPVQSGMMGQGQMRQSGEAREPSAGGMMGPQMRQQMMHGMMGGGMGEQPQSAPQMAGMPQNLTQQDSQGAVTVSVTLLTPNTPRADGKLAVQIKLDPHAVDLDQYQIEKLAVLRDGLVLQL